MFRSILRPDRDTCYGAVQNNVLIPIPSEYSIGQLHDIAGFRGIDAFLDRVEGV